MLGFRVKGNFLKRGIERISYDISPVNKKAMDNKLRQEVGQAGREDSEK